MLGIIRKNKKVQNITDQERLIFLFKTLIKTGKRLPGADNALMVTVNKLNIKPFFDDDIYPGFSEQAFSELLLSVQSDKDFYKKHNMTDYHPSFNFDYDHYFSDQDVVIFYDFTDDFLKEYLEDRLVIQSAVKRTTLAKPILVEEIIVGPLSYGTDGAIRFKGEIIKMRSQMKTLCILFMEGHKELIYYDTIKDELIDAKKRSFINFKTITKYANELHKLLRKHFKHKVIFNYEKDGYIFDIERSRKK